MVDDDGETLTRLVLDLTQAPLLRQLGRTFPVAVVALGVGVSCHRDEAAFEAHPDSLVGDPDSPRPEGHDPAWVWPPRWSPEAFMSYGAFDAEAGPAAYLAGVVLDVQVRANLTTGRSFTVATVDNLFGHVPVCLPGEPEVNVGGIIAGEVYLVADAVPPPVEGCRRWWAGGRGRR